MFKYDNAKLHTDSTNALFIIAFASFYVLVNIFNGFILPFFILTMGSAFWIAFKHPKAGLYASIFLTVIFERFFTLAPIAIGRNEYKLYPLDIVLFAVFAALVFAWLKAQFKPNLAGAGKFLGAFVSLAVFTFGVSTYFYGRDVALSISAFKAYAFYPLLFLATATLLETRFDILRLFKFAFGAAVLLVGFEFYGFIAGTGLWSEYTPLSTEGTRTLAFTHAYYLSMVSLGGLVFALWTEKSPKILEILLPIWILGIVGSLMRHLWIALFAGVVFVILNSVRHEKSAQKMLALAKKYAILLIAVIFMGGYLWALFPNSNFAETGKGILETVGLRATSTFDVTDESIAWRSSMWKLSMAEFAKNPIFGTGFGNKLFIELGEYHDIIEARDTHNSFLVVLMQLGILGLFLLGSFILVIFKTAMAKLAVSRQEIDPVLLASMAILILQLLAFMFQPYLEANMLGIFFWINLAVLLRSSAVLRI